MNFLLRRLAGAILYAIPFYCGAQLFFEQAVSNNSQPRFFLSMALFFCVIAIIAYAIAMGFIDTIYNKKRPVSQILYRMAERFIEKKRYHEAIYEYEKIINRHPQEIRAHLGLIQILKENHHNPSYLEKAIARARVNCSTYSDFKTFSSQVNLKN